MTATTTANPVSALTKAEILQALAAGSIDATEASRLLSQLEPQAATKSNGSRKTVCTISREEFRKAAKPLEVTINGQTMVADAKEFSTGSFGFGSNGKLNVKIGDKLVVCQLSLNITVVGSKELS